MVYIWITAFVLFIVAEAATVSLISIWFALGSAVALVAAALNAPLWFQFVLFIVTSGLVLLFLRPLAKRAISARKVPTNADRVIGMLCTVNEEIDNIAGTGAVSVDGKVWTARSADGSVIPSGTVVRALSIQGVKLIVEDVQRTAPQSGGPHV